VEEPRPREESTDAEPAGHGGSSGDGSSSNPKDLMQISGARVGILEGRDTHRVGALPPGDSVLELAGWIDSGCSSTGRTVVRRPECR
jgi:hypothetical protein